MKRLILIVMMISIIFIVQNVEGFGSTFLPNGRMELEAEETQEFCFYLQNVGEKAKQDQIKILDGRDLILNITDVEKIRVVEPNTRGSNFPVCMEVILPQNSTIGSEHKISYSVQEIPFSEEIGDDLVQIQPITIRRSFIVDHTGEIQKQRIYILEGLIVGILFMLTLIFLKNKKVENNDNRNREEKKE